MTLDPYVGITATPLATRLQSRGPRVHILLRGLPLCGFSYKLPVDWPPGHKWVGLDESNDATCLHCIMLVPAALAREP